MTNLSLNLAKLRHQLWVLVRKLILKLEPARQLLLDDLSGGLVAQVALVTSGVEMTFA
jgi:hypothetical protein